MAVRPPGLDVTVYPVITEPPLSVGAVNETVACPFSAVAETPVGANGTLSGIIAAEGADASDVPIEFVAVTMNVYEDVMELWSSIGMNLLVAYGFYLEWKEHKKTN